MALKDDRKLLLDSKLDLEKALFDNQTAESALALSSAATQDKKCKLDELQAKYTTSLTHASSIESAKEKLQGEFHSLEKRFLEQKKQYESLLEKMEGLRQHVSREAAVFSESVITANNDHEEFVYALLSEFKDALQIDVDCATVFATQCSSVDSALRAFGGFF